MLWRPGRLAPTGTDTGIAPSKDLRLLSTESASTAQSLCSVEAPPSGRVRPPPSTSNRGFQKIPLYLDPTHHVVYDGNPAPLRPESHEILDLALAGLEQEGVAVREALPDLLCAPLTLPSGSRGSGNGTREEGAQRKERETSPSWRGTKGGEGGPGEPWTTRRTRRGNARLPTKLRWVAASTSGGEECEVRNSRIWVCGRSFAGN